MKNLIYYKKFIDYLNNNNFNKTTILAYRAALISFSKYLKEENLSLYDIDGDIINRFLNNLKNKNSTKNVYRAGIIKYLDFLLNNYNLNLNYKNIKSFKNNKNKVRIVDWEKIEGVLLFLKKTKSPINLRDLVIINLIIKTGIKISDLINIKSKDFNNNDSTIIVGDKKILVSVDVANIINDLLLNLSDKSEYLLKSYSTNKTILNKLNIRTIERIIRKYFSEYNYNDLKMIYFKHLLEHLPEINCIEKHKIKEIKELGEIFI